MNEVTYAHMLMNEMDNYFDAKSFWSEAYQEHAYDVVKIFKNFDHPEAAVVPILQGIERQTTMNIDWFTEFQVFLEQFDKEQMTYEYIQSIKRKPTEMCKVLLQRTGVDRNEINEIIAAREKQRAEVFSAGVQSNE